jgi:hypothetical protein
MDLEHEIETETKPKFGEQPPNKRIGCDMADSDDEDNSNSGATPRTPSFFRSSFPPRPPRPPRPPIEVLSFEEWNPSYRNSEKIRKVLPYGLAIAGMTLGLLGAHELNKNLYDNFWTIQMINYLGFGLLGATLPLLVYKKIKR